MRNLNIGVLGHVDSGKTCLCRALSATPSTAAFDKSPQSQVRGITLDLGFSSRVLAPKTDPLCAPYLKNLRLASDSEKVNDSNIAYSEEKDESNEDKLCCTFVDCPGHATLIRTIVGGAQIIDVMILVIDATKGVQAQTAECLVIGEILARPLVVVINKVDSLIPCSSAKPSENSSEGENKEGGAAFTAEEKTTKLRLEKLRMKLAAMFSKTRWPQVEMIEVSAAVPYRSELVNTSEEGERIRSLYEGSGNLALSPFTKTRAVNVELVLPAVLRCAPLKELLRTRWRRMEKESLEYASTLPAPFLSFMGKENFIMLADHCFAVRGHGTVFTGTVLQGRVEVGDTIWIPTLQAHKKVKGLQVFKRQVLCARLGDRVGLCVTQLDPSSFERGILCSGSGGSSRSCKSDLFCPSGITEGNEPRSSAKNLKNGEKKQNALPSERMEDITGNSIKKEESMASLTIPLLLSLPVLTKVFIARVYRIRLHRLPCDTLTKFHIILGHTTVMGTFRYFSRLPKSSSCKGGTQDSPVEKGLPRLPTFPSGKRNRSNATEWEGESLLSFSTFDVHEEGVAEEELPMEAALQFCSATTGMNGEPLQPTSLPHIGQLLPPCPTSKEYYAVVLLEEPVPACINGTFVGMRLDVQREGVCRIAITGNIQYIYPYSSSATATTSASSTLDSVPELSWRSLPVYRYKTRKLQVCRVLDDKTCIADGVIQLISGQTGAEKDTHARHAEAQKFVGVSVHFVPFHSLHHDPTTIPTSSRMEGKKEEFMAFNRSDSVCGVIHSTFGKSGKVRLEFSKPVFAPLESSGKRKKRSGGTERKEKYNEVDGAMTEVTSTSEADQVDEAAPPLSSIFIHDGEVVLEIRKAPFAVHYDSLKEIRTQ